MFFQRSSSDPSCVQARRWTLAICAALLITFALLAWLAVLGKSPTADEPYHAMAGWLRLWKSDYCIDSEDPPLWNMLAAVAAPPGTIRIDEKMLDRSNLPMDTRTEYLWAIKTLFRTPGNNGPAFINRFRAVMLGVAVALAALLGVMVWRMARAIGATPVASGAATVFATGLFALDPNFLAHAPLVKNDVVSALVLLGLTFCTWLAGQTLTLGRIIALSICAGAALSVKFNGPLLIANSAALLLIRAVVPSPWESLGTSCVSRFRRVVAASGTLAVMGAVSIATIWLSYGLRFAPAAGATMNISVAQTACLSNAWKAKHTDGINLEMPTRAQVFSMPRPTIVRLATWANARRLLPQSFLAGLLYVFQSEQTRATFLCGETRVLGTWWYFPFAMAVKTPVATLAVFAALAIWPIVWLLSRKAVAAPSDVPVFRIEPWTALCVVLPAVLYLSAAMMQNLNLGLRHVLPIYPLLFAAAGLGLAKLWDRRRMAALVAGLVVMAALGFESLGAYPDYIPFFNVLAGGSGGGLRLLSDSNLDWGQDLPLLAQWQRQHADTKLYLAYFGTADPAYYGIRYTNINEGYWAGPPAQGVTTPGVIAISATTLQGTYCGRVLDMPTWSGLWPLKPFDVLGGSIYLFHVPSTPQDYLPPGRSLIN